MASIYLFSLIAAALVIHSILNTSKPARLAAQAQYSATINALSLITRPKDA